MQKQITPNIHASQQEAANLSWFEQQIASLSVKEYEYIENMFYKIVTSPSCIYNPYRRQLADWLEINKSTASEFGTFFVNLCLIVRRTRKAQKLSNIYSLGSAFEHSEIRKILYKYFPFLKNVFVMQLVSFYDAFKKASKEYIDSFKKVKVEVEGRHVNKEENIIVSLSSIVREISQSFTNLDPPNSQNHHQIEENFHQGGMTLFVNNNIASESIEEESMELIEALKKLKRAYQMENAAIDSYNKWPTPQNDKLIANHQKFRENVERRVEELKRQARMIQNDPKMKQAERYEAE